MGTSLSRTRGPLAECCLQCSVCAVDALEGLQRDATHSGQLQASLLCNWSKVSLQDPPSRPCSVQMHPELSKPP